MKKLKGVLVLGSRRISGLDVWLEETRRQPDEVGLSGWRGHFVLSPKDATDVIVSNEEILTLTLSDGRSGQIGITSIGPGGPVEFVGAGPLR